MKNINDLKLLIITGMSGAGKTVVMQGLEDAGFYCVDNLPPQMIPTFSDIVNNSENQIKNIALATDLRTLDFLESLPVTLENLRKDQIFDFKMIFLEAKDETLIQRYKQSRRKHPMSKDDNLLKGIQKERELLKKVREKADVVIDTSSLKPLELKEKINLNFEKAELDIRMNVNLMSFGFKYGVPIDADLIFDVRFLPNPYYVDNLRPRTGKEKDVSDYVFAEEKSREYVRKLVDFLMFTLPEYEKEGKQQLVIAIGCTGGKHRSVATTEKLFKEFKEKYQTFANHRDIGKE